MTPDGRRLVVLGPQRERPDVGREVAALRGSGRVALVTAGWQEWEEDDLWLRETIGGSVINLELHRRAERVAEEDPELAAAHRALQQRVQLLRRAYNLRLAHAMDAWITLERMSGDEGVLHAERAAALTVVQALDRHHVERLAELRGEFDHQWRPAERWAVAKQRAAVDELLRDTGVVVVAGGHVPVILNRLRLFGLSDALASRHVVAWSGGAMALAERVVLFHDSPPWGPGHAEVGERGLGVFSGLVPLPDGSTRLRIDDAERVARFARRFAPDVCLLLDPGVRAERDGEQWTGGGGQRLTESGGTSAWRAVA